MNRLQLCFLFLCSLSLSCGICPEGPGCGPCHSSGPHIYLECRAVNGSSTFYVQFKPDEYLYIDCHNSSNWSEFHLETIPEIQSVESIRFESCPGLENGQIGVIKRQLNITNLRELRFFSSVRTEALNVSRNTLRDFKGIERLYLKDNNLVGASSDFLHDFSNLKTLYLSGSTIERLPDNFLTMQNLRVVDLRDNYLQEIGPNAFRQLKKLERLSISNNKLFRIMPNTFDKLINLRSIDLEGNQLETLPDDIFATLPNFEEVNVSKNNFTSEFLSRGFFRNISKLQLLRFCGNKQNFTTLPSKFLADMINLKVVILSENGLITLSEDLFFRSFNLFHLDMERNFIENLPLGIFRDCTHLETIRLNSNRIIYLQDNIFSNLLHLKTLELSDNRIITISKNTFDRLYTLEVLDMTRNNLQIIKNPLELVSLRIAKFSYNNLSLQNYPENESPFFYCHNMEHLHLAYNRISYIFDDWIKSSKLQELNLRGNKLEEITQRKLLIRLNNNLVIDLRDNEIREIPPISFNKSDYEQQIGYFGPRKLTIIIDGNPLECDCEVYDLLRFLEERTDSFVHDFLQFDVGSLKCREPSSLKNTLVTSLNSETFKCFVNESQLINATCPEKCDCWLRPYNRAFVIDCSNKGLDQAPAKIEVPEGHLIELNLTGNHLTSMPSMSQLGYENVTVLSLAHNDISNIPLESLSTNLRKLELHNNKLSKIDTGVLKYLINCPNLINLTFHKNPWECNCEFFKFIQKMRPKIPTLNDVACEGEGKFFFEINFEEICPHEMGWMIASCIGIAVLGIFIAGLVAIYYNYQQEIKIWLYARQWCLRWITEDELDKDKIYDAFISYSHKDDDFVVNQLVAKLEEEPRPFKLCVHYRDWVAGEWISKQVISSVENSKRTIVVLSTNFLGSEWGKVEFRTAHKQALSDGRARVIIIIYGEIPPVDQLDSELQAYLTMNTYVKWGDPWFWDKLRFALPHRQNQFPE